MNTLKLAIVMFVGVTFACSAFAQQATTPPIVNWRDISTMPRIAQGERVDFDTSTTLFLPEGWRERAAAAPHEICLTIHYHSAIWYAIEEHARRGATTPLLAFYPGEGSSTYANLYPTRTPFDEQITSVTAELAKRLGLPNVEISQYELESFSAGYGAIRELLKHEDIANKTRAVVLADSLYASATTDTQGCRVPDPQQMQPFIDYAKRAANGEKKMVVAHSSIAIASYCSTVETADAILRALEIKKIEQPKTDAPGPDFPLVSRGDSGNLHVWGYGGPDAKAHSAIARAIADYWKQLD